MERKEKPNTELQNMESKGKPDTELQNTACMESKAERVLEEYLAAQSNQGGDELRA